MWDKNAAKLTSYSPLSAMILAGGLVMALGDTAQALTADDVLNKMNSDQRVGYVAGLVGGFAYSRFLQDRPDQTGMDCVYDWYYGSGTQKWEQIEAWFARHPEKQAEPLLYVLIKKECEE